MRYVFTVGHSLAILAGIALACYSSTARAADPPPVQRAVISGDDLGSRQLTADDFTRVNSQADTWTFDRDEIRCTGNPVSVIRTKEQLKNFELVVQWMHHKPAGNSGVFVWTTPESIDKLTQAGKPGLPSGIEVQVLDTAYGQPNPEGWYTSHGDVFPVGVKMKPFPPLSPDGSRSFPRKNLMRDHGQWNHYYIRAINGEVRLWVNGEEVSGGAGCDPSTGYLCLESEGSPITFKGLKVRALP